jgi:hypothetical protein
VAPPTASASQIDRLIADLGSDDEVQRDAAVARLRVLGAGAVPRLAGAMAAGRPTAARVAALDALDGIDDRRVPDLAVGVLDDDDPETVVAALGVLRPWVARETGTRLLETLTTIATDQDRHARIRAAAIEALADLPDELTAPIRAHAPPPEAAGPDAGDPVAAREWVEAHGAAASLSGLHDLIKSLRERERAERAPRRRLEWLRARGATHRALADRGSRLALFDLRETFDGATGPLPDGFAEAAAAIGDATCLQPLARAWAATPGDPAWRTRLQTTARDILRRARLTGRNATVKSVRARWPGFV